MLSRRNVIMVLGGAVSTSLIKPISASAQSARIAIIGVGLSGLTAAMHFIDNGFSPQIYETDDHVGGRVHSRRN